MFKACTCKRTWKYWNIGYPGDAIDYKKMTIAYIGQVVISIAWFTIITFQTMFAPFLYTYVSIWFIWRNYEKNPLIYRDEQYNIALLYTNVCLFGFFSSHSRIFLSYGDVTVAGEGLQILTDARLSWPLSNEGSLACHTYCDTEHPFIMVISEDPWH